MQKDHLNWRARANRTRPTRILARSMYQKLVDEGYDEFQIVAFASEVIGMIAKSRRARDVAPKVAFPRPAERAA